MYSSNLQAKAIRTGGDRRVLHNGEKEIKPFTNKPLTRKQAIQFILENSPLSRWAAEKITDNFLDVYTAKKDQIFNGVEIKKNQSFFLPINIISKLQELQENYKNL